MKFRIVLRSLNKEIIEFGCEQLRFALEKAQYNLKGTIALPTKFKKFCVLRSPHIDKDSREHFEIRFYKRFLDLTAISPSIIDLLLNTELPAGISCDLKILKKRKVFF